MADDRNRRERDRFPERDQSSRREDDGYIARHGFGNRSAGYDRGPSGSDDRSGFERGGSYGRGSDDGSGFERGGSYGRGSDDRSGYGRGGSFREDEGRSGGRSGFERGGSFRREEDRFGGRERDFGDSAGYGTGGSTRDWREVMGDEGSGREFRRGPGGFSREDEGRYGASDFGRGSRGDHDDRGFLERAGDEIRSWFGDDDRDERHHRGRGPKNYQRSDERIREDLNDRLTDDPHVDASEIEVSVSNREVTLTGIVNSRFEKRHAEDIAESVSGVAHVQNNLRVGSSSGSGMGSSTLTGAGGSLEGGSGSASGGGLNVGATGTGSIAGTDLTNRGGSRRRTPTS